MRKIFSPSATAATTKKNTASVNSGAMLLCYTCNMTLTIPAAGAFNKIYAKYQLRVLFEINEEIKLALQLATSNVTSMHSAMKRKHKIVTENLVKPLKSVLSNNLICLNSDGAVLV